MADTSVGDCQSNHLPSIFNFSSGAVVQSDIDQLASWGIDLLKVDSCAPHPPRDPVDMWAGFNATYPAVGQALLEAGRAHNRTILFSCSWPACESSRHLQPAHEPAPLHMTVKNPPALTARRCHRFADARAAPAVSCDCTS